MLILALLTVAVYGCAVTADDMPTDSSSAENASSAERPETPAQGMTMVVLPSPPMCKTTDDAALTAKVRGMFADAVKTLSEEPEPTAGWEIKIDFDDGTYASLGGNRISYEGATYVMHDEDCQALVAELKEIYQELAAEETPYR